MGATEQNDSARGLCHCPSAPTATCTPTPPAIPSVSASGSRAGHGGQYRSPPTSAGSPSTRPTSLKRVVDAANTHLLPIAKEPADAYRLRDEVFQAIRSFGQGNTSASVRGRTFRDIFEAQAQLQFIDSAISAALTAADEQKVKEAFQSLLTSLKLTGLVIVVAVLTFVTVAGILPESDRINEPVEVAVHLRSTANRGLLGLGPRRRARLVGVAVGGTFQEPTVVVAPQGGCEAARFTVTRDVGIAIPAIRP